VIDAIIIIFAIIGVVAVLAFVISFGVAMASYIRAHRDDEIECTADGRVYRGAFGPLLMWFHDAISGPRRRAGHHRAEAEFHERFGLPPR